MHAKTHTHNYLCILTRKHTHIHIHAHTCIPGGSFCSTHTLTLMHTDTHAQAHIHTWWKLLQPAMHAKTHIHLLVHSYTEAHTYTHTRTHVHTWWSFCSTHTHSHLCTLTLMHKHTYTPDGSFCSQPCTQRHTHTHTYLCILTRKHTHIHIHTWWKLLQPAGEQWLYSQLGRLHKHHTTTRYSSRWGNSEVLHLWKCVHVCVCVCACVCACVHASIYACVQQGSSVWGSVESLGLQTFTHFNEPQKCRSQTIKGLLDLKPFFRTFGSKIAAQDAKNSPRWPSNVLIMCALIIWIIYSRQ